MSIKLYNCDCEYEEIQNKVNSGIKGYVKVKECDSCKIKREADAQLSNDRIVEQERELKIRQEMDNILRTQAIENLQNREEL